MRLSVLLIYGLSTCSRLLINVMIKELTINNYYTKLPTVPKTGWIGVKDDAIMLKRLGVTGQCSNRE